MNICDDVQVHVLSDYMTDTDAFNYFTATQRPDLLAKYKRKDWLTKKQCKFGQIVNQIVRNENEITHTTRKIRIYGINEKFVNIPSCIVSIKTSDPFRGEVVLPPNLTHLEFGGSFNHPLGPLPPPTLTHLKLGDEFNHPLGPLPQSLTHLEFGGSFNHPLGPLPQSLTHLELGNNFNHDLGPLPPNLEFLKLGRNYDIKRLDIDEIKKNYTEDGKTLRIQYTEITTRPPLERHGLSTRETLSLDDPRVQAYLNNHIV